MRLIGLIDIAILHRFPFRGLQLVGLLLLLFEFLLLFFFLGIFFLKLFDVFLQLLIFCFTCWREVFVINIIAIIKYICILLKCLTIFNCIGLFFYLLLN